MIMILLLLIGFISWSTKTDAQNSSTGGFVQVDTAMVAITVEAIRKANTKLIERQYLIEINKQQDSIISMKDDYINQQKSVIVDFQKRVADANKLNESVKADLDKYKKQNKLLMILCVITSSFAVGAIIF